MYHHSRFSGEVTGCVAFTAIVCLILKSVCEDPSHRLL